MADKKYVLVKCDVKDIFDPKLKAAAAKAMEKSVTDAINSGSGGKLSTKDKSDEGFIVTVTLVSLKADDKDSPKKLDAKFTITVMTMGSTTKAFTGNAGGALDGVGNNLQSAVTDLVGSVLDGFMPKVVKTMLSL